MEGIKLLALLCLLISVTQQQLCFDGEYPDSQNQCQPCDLSCETCESELGCSTCYPNMYLAPKGNRVLCDVCSAVNKGCEICASSSVCQSCRNGYHLKPDGKCGQCTQFISNCLFCRQPRLSPEEQQAGVPEKALECLSCKFGWDLSRTTGACEINAEQQQILAAREAQGIELNVVDPVESDSTQEQSFLPVVTPTVVTVDPPTAQPPIIPQSFICPNGYIDIEGNCFLKLQWCIDYNKFNGLCQGCEVGYLPSNQGVCIHELLAFFQQNQNFQQQAQQIPNSNQPQQSPTTTAPPVNTFSPPSAATPNNAVPTPICIVLDASTGDCLNCTQGFDLFNGLCVQQAILPATQPAPAVQESAPAPAIAADPAPLGPVGNPNAAQAQASPSQVGPNDPNCRFPDFSTGLCNGCKDTYLLTPSTLCVLPPQVSDCVYPCQTCRLGLPTICVTCAPGFTTVDALPDQCFATPGTTPQPPQQPQPPQTTFPPRLVCALGCATCRNTDPNYCTSCSLGYASVDDPAFAGRCFKI